MEDFNFISDGAQDKLAFHTSGTKSAAAWADIDFNIAHSAPTQFVPIIRYTANGTTWYYNGDGRSINGFLEMQLRAEASDTAVRVVGFAGPNAVNYTYEIYGISKNV